MKAVTIVAFGGLLLAASAARQSAPRRAEPFLAVGVTYRAELVADRERAQADFEAIRALAFNTIRVPLAWPSAEPARGTYRLDSLDRTFDLASRAGLKVILQLDTAVPPGWLLPKSIAARSNTACAEPKVTAAATAFVATATALAAKHPAFLTLALDSSMPAGDCVAFDRRANLLQLVGAAAARGDRTVMTWTDVPSVLIQASGPSVRDDWTMASAVDEYGTAVPPLSALGGMAPHVQLALALDGVRSASKDKGWMMLESASPLPSAATGLRLSVWAAVSRGARGVLFGDWRPTDSRAAAGLVDPDGTLTERARTAGAIARVIARNPALFAPLRPRPAKVALIYDPRRPSTSDALYRAIFERNVPVDFVHVNDVATGHAARYTLVLSGPPSTAEQTSIAKLVPEVRIEGATGPVETRFLESADVLMFIGLNHADTPQRVTFTFSAETQEAIWQNMETGSAVNFVAGLEGPRYTYSFAPKDAVVLMIRKDIR